MSNAITSFEFMGVFDAIGKPSRVIEKSCSLSEELDTIIFVTIASVADGTVYSNVFDVEAAPLNINFCNVAISKLP